MQPDRKGGHRAWRNPCAGCLPHVRVTQHTVPAVQMPQHVCSVSAPGSPLETQNPLFLGGCQGGTLCFACTKFPEGKQVFSIDHMVHTDRLGTVNPPIAAGNTESQFPGVSHRPALQTGLSKDGSLRRTLFFSAHRRRHICTQPGLMLACLCHCVHG